MFQDSFGDVLADSVLTARELYCNTRDELASISDISTPTREEKTRSEFLLIIMLASDCASNRRFSRTRQTGQPEYATFILSGRPSVYVLKEIDTRFLEAGGFMLLCLRVKRGVIGSRYMFEDIMQHLVMISEHVPRYWGES